LSDSTSGFVRVLRQITHEREKLRRLADEKPHRRQETDHAHGNTSCLGRANDRNHGELSAQEWARLRHDQVGLKILATKWRRIQVWKGDGCTSYRIHRSQRRRIARLVRPGLKVDRKSTRLNSSHT